jgi:hypothetical protein
MRTIRSEGSDPSNPVALGVELTRRNLLSLLAKLDGHPADSACTIQSPDGFLVKAVEDDAHYSDRRAGHMHPETEKMTRTASWVDTQRLT